MKKEGNTHTQATPWTNHKDNVSEVSQPRKDEYCTTPLSAGTWRSRVHRATKEQGGRRGLGKGAAGNSG